MSPTNSKPQPHLLLLLLLLAAADSAPATISRANFQAHSYTGYISENVELPQPKLHANSTPPHAHPILIRFVDILKPTVEFQLTPANLACTAVDFTAFKQATNIRLSGDDDATTLFDIDPNTFACQQQLDASVCTCHIQIKLRDDSVRYRLNREAKSAYEFQLKLDQAYAIRTAAVVVNVLDDNDLEPMFDPAEYELEVNEFDRWPAFTRIGQVLARDPDLDRNAELRYYISANGNDSAGEYFGVDWRTGHVFVKKSVDVMFGLAFGGASSGLRERVFEFEVKSLDNGVRANVARNLLKRQEKGAKSVSRARKMLFEDEEENGEDHDDLGGGEFSLSTGEEARDRDLINYKLVEYAAGVQGGSEAVYWGTSIEAAYVSVRLVRSFKAEENYAATFRRLSEITVDRNLKEQIR